LIERIYGFVDAREVDKAVFGSLRLARASADTFNAAMFLRELYPDLHQLRAAFLEETLHLNQDTRQELWKTTQDWWSKSEQCRVISFLETKVRTSWRWAWANCAKTSNR
jgi:hypothetical protein